MVFIILYSGTNVQWYIAIMHAILSVHGTYIISDDVPGCSRQLQLYYCMALTVIPCMP